MCGWTKSVAFVDCLWQWKDDVPLYPYITKEDTTGKGIYALLHLPFVQVQLCFLLPSHSEEGKNPKFRSSYTSSISFINIVEGKTFLFPTPCCYAQRCFLAVTILDKPPISPCSLISTALLLGRDPQSHSCLHLLLCTVWPLPALLVQQCGTVLNVEHSWLLVIWVILQTDCDQANPKYQPKLYLELHFLLWPM